MFEPERPPEATTRYKAVSLDQLIEFEFEGDRKIRKLFKALNGLEGHFERWPHDLYTEHHAPLVDAVRRTQRLVDMARGLRRDLSRRRG